MLRALRNEIIVKPIYEKNRGKIIIPPDSPHFKQYHGRITGEVISIGPRSIFKKDVDIGDKIVWLRHEGKKIIFERQVYFSVRDRWIMGKVIE